MNTRALSVVPPKRSSKAVSSRMMDLRRTPSALPPAGAWTDLRAMVVPPRASRHAFRTGWRFGATHRSEVAGSASTICPALPGRVRRLAGCKNSRRSCRQPRIFRVRREFSAAPDAARAPSRLSTKAGSDQSRRHRACLSREGAGAEWHSTGPQHHNRHRRLEPRHFVAEGPTS